jgi:membrane protease YdiL (CAAX protease family)
LIEWKDKAGREKTPRGFELALFTASLLWAGCASVTAGSAAAGIAGRLGWTYGQTLLEAVFLLFLVLVGFRLLDWIATRGKLRGQTLPLPWRKTAGREWGTGVSIGWGMCLAAVLPVLLSGHFDALLSRGPGVISGLLVAVATLLTGTLAEEAIFRGYPFRRLMGAIGPAWAAVTMSVLFAGFLVIGRGPRHYGVALLDGLLLGLVLAIAYERTHALWVGWGLHFGYRAVMAAVLGLPIAGRNDLGSLLDARATGPSWLSGRAYGLDAAWPTAIVLMAAIVAVYRTTKDWAWAYTLPEILPAGYEVTVAPPAAHVAMEKAAAPPPLVQILVATPQGFSTGVVPDETDRLAGG